jgi:hypothetical protein
MRNNLGEIPTIIAELLAAKNSAGQHPVKQLSERIHICTWGNHVGASVLEFRGHEESRAYRFF